MKLVLALVAMLGLATPSLAETKVNLNKVKLAPNVTAETATMVCSKDKKTGQLLCKPLEDGTVEFTTTNLITLRGPIFASSASQFVAKFHELEHKDEVSKIYVYVKSPGGSIFAGDYISNIIASSKKEVVVVIDFAASMAFHVSHFADKKLMLPTGTMMQHHASGGTGGGEFPNVDKQWDWIKRKVGMMNQKDATACKNTTYDSFMQNIDRDWWLLSGEAVEAGCVDGVATRVTCSKDLSNTTVKETFRVFGMSIQLTWSGCPLETYPRSVRAGRVGSFRNLTEKQQAMVEDFLMLLTDPLQYYNKKGSFDLDRYFDPVQEQKVPFRN